jgi:hypothetical protein
MRNRNIGRKTAGACLIAALLALTAAMATAPLLVGGSAGAVAVTAARDGSPASATGTMRGGTRVPFWPHETGALAGTAETYVDMRADGSYYDPSLGRRISGR